MGDGFAATRRQFIQDGLTLISAAATVPTFLDRTAIALGAEPSAGASKRKGGSNDRILVVLQLAGGNDGLNTIIPYRSDAYYRARPQIGIAKKDALVLTDDVGLHPSAVGLKELYDEGLLSVVQAVGYPNPDRSHFKSTEIWETGDPTQRDHHGWLGRYFDCTCKGDDVPDPKAAIALTSEAPLALQGTRFSPVAFSQPEQLAWQPGKVSKQTRDAFERLNNPDDDHNPDGTLKTVSKLEYLQRTAMDARMSARDIQNAAGGGRGRVAGAFGGGQRGGGGQLAGQLQMVARMIAADLPTRVYYVSLGGFDTHAQQLGRHQQLMQQLGAALKQFFADLRSSGQLERVLVMTFSEFGRRVEQNASQGTDHGQAAPMFLIGSKVRAGVQNAHPDLRQLSQGDIPWQIDFRAVYAAILANWLRTDARKVLGGQFPNLDLIKKR